MKKMTWKMRLLGGLVAVSMLFAGCAQGVDDETFEAGVTGTQLESPAADSFAVAFVTDASGAEQVKVTWPVVVGAGGYLCNVWNVNNPDKPEVILENYKNDGAALYFPLVEDSNYKVTVQTLGNEKYGNKDALSTTEVDVKTMIEGIPVPTTEDVGAFITKYITDNAEKLAKERAANPNFEIAFDLEAGKTYQMGTVADCGIQPTRVRGDRQNKPTIVFTEGSNAHFQTAAGLKLKFLNIDADGLTSSTSGLITAHQNPDKSVEIVNKTYMCRKPIRMETCWVKNLHSALYTGCKQSWGIAEFRVTDCIIQLNNDFTSGGKSLLYPYGNGQNYGSIFATYITNSTIYNIVEGSAQGDSAYFVRFNNENISSIFGTYAGTFQVRNSTICRVTAKKNAADRTPKGEAFTGLIENTIWYDCQAVYKLKQGSATWSTPNSVVYNVTKSTHSDDPKHFVIEDPGISVTEMNTALDFSKPNGGVNFKPTGAVSSSIGDPRWL